MYGLGGGVLADELGLLLTLGDYQTAITYTLLVGMVVAAATGSLVHHYWCDVVTELKRITLWERVAILGLFLLLFPIVLVTFGIPADAVGLVIAGAYRTRFGRAWKISRRQLFLELSYSCLNCDSCPRGICGQSHLSICIRRLPAAAAHSDSRTVRILCGGRVLETSRRVGLVESPT